MAERARLTGLPRLADRRGAGFAWSRLCRFRIGHRAVNYILSSMRTDIVAAGIVVEHGSVLLTRRKKGSHLAGCWEFPGGKTEPGEDPRAALRRELEEELGIFVRVGEIVDVTFHRYDDADKSVLLLFFRAEREEGSPAPRAIDVAEVKWGDASALDPAEFPPADLAVLSKVRALIA